MSDPCQEMIRSSITRYKINDAEKMAFDMRKALVTEYFNADDPTSFPIAVGNAGSSDALREYGLCHIIPMVLMTLSSMFESERIGSACEVLISHNNQILIRFISRSQISVVSELLSLDLNQLMRKKETGICMERQRITTSGNDEVYNNDVSVCVDTLDTAPKHPFELFQPVDSGDEEIEKNSSMREEKDQEDVYGVTEDGILSSPEGAAFGTPHSPTCPEGQNLIGLTQRRKEDEDEDYDFLASPSASASASAYAKATASSGPSGLYYSERERTKDKLIIALGATLV